jgi:hypothetical protein
VVDSQRSLRRRRDPLVGGLVLVIIGIVLLAAQFTPDFAQYVVLVIGLILLAIFVANRSYGALVGGAIVTGVGVGVVLATIYEGDVAAAAVLMSMGTGFLAIWVVSYLLSMKERHFWPVIPGAILFFIGGGIAVDENATDWIAYWPVVLIVIGVVVMAVALLRGARTAEEED